MKVWMENVYRLQIMNTAETPHQFAMSVRGLPEARLVADTPVVSVAGASSIIVPVSVQVDPSAVKPGPIASISRFAPWTMIDSSPAPTRASICVHHETDHSRARLVSRTLAVVARGWTPHGRRRGGHHGLARRQERRRAGGGRLLQAGPRHQSGDPPRPAGRRPWFTRQRPVQLRQSAPPGVPSRRGGARLARRDPIAHSSSDPGRRRPGRGTACEQRRRV